MQSAKGFPPVARADARILILGSLPGQRSIAAQQYYAHPRNAFWSIMQELFEIHGAYEDRLLQLLDNKIALWDVLGSSVRPGSLDSSIDLDSARVNDFAAFLDAHRDIRLIAFNGKKAAQMFRRFVASDVVGREVELAFLPSTSPAYAAMPFSGKLVAWRDALQAGEHAMSNGSRR
ncbi:MAG: DNA-deoxyinosine glycosylase [Woeseiaceae bacterium]